MYPNHFLLLINLEPLYHFLLLPRLLLGLVPVVYDPTFPIIFQSTLSVTILANKRSAVDLLEVLGKIHGALSCLHS